MEKESIIEGEAGLKKERCLRCGYRWVARVADIKTCPRCRSPYFDRPRKEKK